MRFIGNKESIVEKIYDILNENKIEGDSFFDFFSGTTNVSKFFKKKNYTIYSSDLLYFSYVLQKAYIENNQNVHFDKLIQKYSLQDQLLFESPLELIIDYLNKIKGINGFIYKNYCPEGTKNLEKPRMYFSNENAKKIDAIRIKIENWKKKDLINENEYYVLLSCLIESVPFYANISGVYSAFHKKWDPRAIKDFVLRPIEIINNNKNNYSYNGNSINLIKDINIDILYLDPPYNQRQYAPNYHILETIAKYDNPIIKGITGMRSYENEKSNFCNHKMALNELSKIVNNANYKYLIMSYNNEGLMSKEEILSIMSKKGKVKFVEFNYTRFKSNNNGSSKFKKEILEQLYILKL